MLFGVPSLRIMASNRTPSTTNHSTPDMDKKTKVGLNEKLIITVNNDSGGEVLVVEMLLKHLVDINGRKTVDQTLQGSARECNTDTEEHKTINCVVLEHSAVIDNRKVVDQIHLGNAGVCDTATREEVINVLQQHPHQEPVQESQQPVTSTHHLDPHKLENIDEILLIFAEYFVQEYESKTCFYGCIIEGTLKKSGKTVDTFAEMAGQVSGGTIGGLLGVLAGFPAEGAAAGLKLGGKATKALGALLGSSHYRKEALKLMDVTEWYQQHKVSFRKLLVDTACDLLQSFEMQFSKVNSDFGPRNALHYLAKDAVNRSFNYFLSGGCFDLSSGDNLSLGETVLLGDSKIEPLFGCVPVYHRKVKKPGSDLRWESDGLKLKWKSSSMFSKPGLVKQGSIQNVIGGGTQDIVYEIIQTEKKYFTMGKNGLIKPSRYGYRRLLSTEDWNHMQQHYIEDKSREAELFRGYQFSLQAEDLQKHSYRILEHINNTDPALMEERLRAILQENQKDMVEVIDFVRDQKALGEQDRKLLRSVEMAVQAMNFDAEYFKVHLGELRTEQKCLITCVDKGFTDVTGRMQCLEDVIKLVLEKTLETNNFVSEVMMDFWNVPKVSSKS